MGVEFFKTINPYGPKSKRFVTSSPLKAELCRGVGIETEEDGRKMERVSVGETNHDNENGHGVVVRSRISDIPYQIYVALAKAKALLHNLEPNGHRHVWEMQRGRCWMTPE